MKQDLRPSRRDMLKTTALAGAALAFPSIVPSTVFGANAPSNRVNLAAIGVGGRGFGDCQHAFLPLGDMRFVAVADCFKSRRESFARMCNRHYKGNVCTPYADFREVLARKDVDGIVVSTPDHWHVPIAFYAAQAKKDMYVEKPLGVALAWAWKLREEVAKNKVIFQYGTQQRGDQGQFRRACELVRNGYIGDIKSVDVWAPTMDNNMGGLKTAHKEAPVPADFDYEMWLGPSPKKPYTPARCTNSGAWFLYDYAIGFIAGWGAHPLDIAQWGLNTDNTGPVLYEGKGTLPPSEYFYDTVKTWDLTCTYASGIKMRFVSTDIVKPIIKEYLPISPGHGTTFHGTKGWICVNRDALYASTKELQKMQVKSDELHLTVAKSQASDFVNSIKTRKPTVSPLESAIRSDTISHLGNICVRTGRSIKWDPEKEQIIGDAEASVMLNRPLREPWKL